MHKRMGLALFGLMSIAACGGSDGAPGTAGKDGANGSNGAAGANGTNGTNGSNGAQGPQGDAGATGSTGPAGDAGAAGPAGDAGATGPAGPSTSAKSYTVVFAVRDASACPSGYNTASVASLAGTNGYTYVGITRSEFYLGGSASASFGQDYLAANFINTAGITELCWQTFTSSYGHPYFAHVDVNGGAAMCPAGFDSIPTAELRGNNTGAYWMSNGSGAYAGYVDNWSYGAPTTSFGYQARYTTGTLNDTMCYRVMGVDSDPSTAKGVYPVTLGVKSPAACPAGYTYVASTTLSATGVFYDVTNDNSMALGAVTGDNYGGADYLYTNVTTSSQLVNPCFKLYPVDGPPHAQVTALSTGTCPAGSVSLNLTDIDSSNATTYVIQTGSALWLGGLYNDAIADYPNGYLYTTETPAQVSTLCYQVSGVDSFP